ncbi:MAG: hypothetical protein ACRDPW_09615 [Mycobacteriales bacterium]
MLQQRAQLCGSVITLCSGELFTDSVVGATVDEIVKFFEPEILIANRLTRSPGAVCGAKWRGHRIHHLLTPLLASAAVVCSAEPVVH